MRKSKIVFFFCLLPSLHQRIKLTNQLDFPSESCVRIPCRRFRFVVSVYRFTEPRPNHVQQSVRSFSSMRIISRPFRCRIPLQRIYQVIFDEYRIISRPFRCIIPLQRTIRGSQSVRVVDHFVLFTACTPVQLSYFVHAYGMIRKSTHRGRPLML